MSTIRLTDTRALLKRFNNEELEPLVKYILKTSTENLSRHPDFKKWQPNHRRYVFVIFDELRKFGGNTFANLWRKDGADYTEVVRDVAKRFKVKVSEPMDVIQLEENILQAVLREALTKSKGEERRELEQILLEAGLESTKITALIQGRTLGALVGPAVARIILYRTSVVIGNTIAKQMLGLSMRSFMVVGAGSGVGSLGAKTLASLAGPIGWGIAGTWATMDAAGPAYRVTIPCVLHIAMLRQKVLAETSTAFMEGAFDG